MHTATAIDCWALRWYGRVVTDMVLRMRNVGDASPQTITRGLAEGEIWYEGGGNCPLMELRGECIFLACCCRRWLFK